MALKIIAMYSFQIFVLYIGFHQMGGEEAMDRYNICIGSNLTCMNVIMNQMGQFDHVDHHGEQMKCR